MLEIRQNCENCNKSLLNDSNEAMTRSIGNTQTLARIFIRAHNDIQT